MWLDIWSAEYTGRRVAVGMAVFQDLFDKLPETKALFTGVGVDDLDSNEFKAHVVRVVNGLDTSINLLDDPAVLDEQLKHLNDQHLARDGVKAEYFSAMGASFLKVMPQISGCFNPDAFSRCFQRISSGITSGLP